MAQIPIVGAYEFSERRIRALWEDAKDDFRNEYSMKQAAPILKILGQMIIAFRPKDESPDFKACMAVALGARFMTALMDFEDIDAFLFSVHTEFFPNQE